MPVIGLDHILIAIPEGAEAQARAFYCGLLGFTEIDKPAALAGRGGLWLRAGDFVLHIGTETRLRRAEARPSGLSRRRSRRR